ncbi:Flp pilus assembly protein CpaB [Gallaecimonas sp. GXIMD4217]|uniref:Flp pilus assembly protein CpaB n=1 Tax=Gallaecimonas sp. GXIMD4217 TaxID=3131927 RepID=UPI00311AD5C7
MTWKDKIDFNWILLVIAIGLGATAAWATKNYFVVKEQELRDALSKDNVVMADVVVATQNLEKGDIISQANMSVRQVPADVLPLDAVHPRRFSEVAGQMLLKPMAPGRPLLNSYLPGHGVEQFSDILGEGRRAVTISIDENNSTAGMLVPADHIDIFLLHSERVDDKKKRKALSLLLEDVVVLATGQRTLEDNPELATELYGDPTAYSTVTLDLSVKDAARVMLAKEKGKFVAMLRNREESQPLAVTNLHEGQLFADTEDNAKVAVEVIVGGRGVTVKQQSYELPKPDPDFTQLSQLPQDQVQ